MKKIIYFLKIILIILILLLSNFNILKVYATQPLVPDVNYYKPIEEPVPQEVTDVSETIIGVIQVVGTIIAVITIMILGIKYMVAGVEERAEYKKSMIPYLIGCILLFVSVTIVSATYQLIKSLTTGI